MTPTLSGRIQTRVFLLVVIGVPWTLLITLVLPEAGSLRTMYRVTFTTLAVVAALGVVWEVVYHGLQQFRWDKDWPALFGLLTGINEAVATWVVLGILLPEEVAVTPAQFAIAFGSLWILVWLVANGPMRVVFLRWRFRGGRLL